MSEWRHARKNPPKMSGTYLCYVVFPGNGGDFVSRVMDLHFSSIEKKWAVEGMIVTHWMPLPEPPGEEGCNETN